MLLQPSLIQTPPLEQTEIESFTKKIATDFKVDPALITTQSVGPSWGADITRQALIGLGVFLLLVILFLTLYFELRMAAAAIVALLHDLLITIGVYAITGFEVTPATVIGILTILGYSLYDTVVVFDKVKENSRGIIAQSRLNYRESANLALNQTLIRSINTSIVALLPVAAILIVGVGTPAALTIFRASSTLMVLGTLNLAPPLNSIPRFSPRPKSPNAAMAMIINETTYQSFLLPTKSTEVSPV